MQQEPLAAHSTLTIADAEYGTKFEAVQIDDQWEINVNDLSNDETARLGNLPKTKEEYQMHANIKHVVQSLQYSMPETFAAGNGKMRWQDEQDRFTYRFELTTDDQGMQTLTGRENENPVFSAQIDPEGRIRPEFSSIPTEQIDDLLAKQAQAAIERSQQQPTL
jgi:hypothetical protein